MESVEQIGAEAEQIGAEAEQIGRQLTPVKAIRAYCLECCCGQVVEVRLCPSTDCPLWEYRMGHRPERSRRVLTEEQKERLTEQLRKARIDNF